MSTRQLFLRCSDGGGINVRHIVRLYVDTGITGTVAEVKALTVTSDTILVDEVDNQGTLEEDQEHARDLVEKIMQLMEES